MSAAAGRWMVTAATAAVTRGRCGSSLPPALDPRSFSIPHPPAPAWAVHAHGLACEVPTGRAQGTRLGLVAGLTSLSRLSQQGGGRDLAAARLLL